MHRVQSWLPSGVFPAEKPEKEHAFRCLASSSGHDLPLEEESLGRVGKVGPVEEGHQMDIQCREYNTLGEFKKVTVLNSGCSIWCHPEERPSEHEEVNIRPLLT